uniref:Putative salivary secreted serine protease inhibitor n=1 Tax=Pandinus cavimanus TaxID=217261 RepID=H2CYN9_PANCV|nr:putative salivary secreted serine protease inhibitor [Pandinus cavimanus]
MRSLVAVLLVGIMTIAKAQSDEGQCGENEFFMRCGGCDGDCYQPMVPCTMICHAPGCYCKEGTVRGPDGSCIPEEECH